MERAAWVCKTIERDLLNASGLKFVASCEKRLNEKKRISAGELTHLERLYRDALWASWGEIWLEDPDEEIIWS